MDYMPVEPIIEADETLFDAPPGASWTRFPKRHRSQSASVEALRYRGLTFVLATGAVLFQEREVSLAAAERELLRTLMRRAGQIISAEWLADQHGFTITEVEDRIRTLAEALIEAGSYCLPRRVEGLGYVLWR